MSTSTAPAKTNGNGGGNGHGLPAPVALTLRPALPSDGVPLSFFFDTVLRNDYFMRRGQLADMLQSPYHQVYIAEIDRILVGVAITTCGTRLVNALVHPAYRGLGIGRALVGYSGATEVRAKLDLSTGDPRGFYGALGFESTGETNAKGNIGIMKLRARPVRARRNPVTEPRTRNGHSRERKRGEQLECAKPTV